MPESTEQMDPAEVLALEVKQYVGPGVRSLVPRVLGRTEHAQRKKASTAVGEGRQWDETSFFEALAERSTADVATARRLLEWGKANGSRIWYGRGSRQGSFFPIIESRGMEYFVIGVWTYAAVELQFQTLHRRPPFDDLPLLREFRQRLNTAPGISIPDDRLTKRPSVPLSVLRSESALAQFIAVLDWAVGIIRNRNQ